MKILRIIARLNVGGPARHVVWLTSGLRSAGYETLLVAGVLPPGEDDMSYFAADLGVQPLIIRGMSREISPRDLLTTWKLFRLMRRERPDIVCTHTAKAGAVGRVAGWMYRWLTPAALVGRPRSCHFVHTYHGHVFHGYYGRLKTGLFLRVERLLARAVSDRIVVVSQQQRREINEEFGVGRPEQFTVLALGIDLSIYEHREQRRSQLREELKAADDEILIGIVGRLVDIKNHDLFLRTAALLKVLRPDSPRVRFVIIGDGSLRPALEAQSKSLGLGDCVVFLGSRQDSEYFYPGLDIVALTSRNEGSPLTLIEGMANARPVIATAVGGVVDLVGPPPADFVAGRPAVCERGLLVKSDDAEGFARGLLLLIGDASLRRELGERGREFVLKHHSKERLVSDMRELYDQLDAGD